ncbi:hypothetical protein KDI_06240 [Dictyobacter arantiisoli]|uniref:Uncharacterized protein n=1 Tax=Dictyobacter arantiisoli TaxID=2014874 RepID=A0A5A5T6H1_9CHLR|nr:hypothetical protein KDI_06240 [Dictyobacter arantiisoli]
MNVSVYLSTDLTDRKKNRVRTGRNGDPTVPVIQKMTHNDHEYGIMQTYGKGFEITMSHICDHLPSQRDEENDHTFIKKSLVVIANTHY